MRLIFSPLLISLLLWGCTSPKTSYYKLNAEPIPVMTSVSNKMRIMVGPVSVPARMDRPQLVTQAAGSEVEVYEYHRWAGSLKGDVGRVISSNIARNLGAPNVWNFAQSTQAQYDYQVLIDVQNLESVQDGDVVVDVLWTIKPSAPVIKNQAQSARTKCVPQEIMGRSLVREPVSGSGFDALLSAQSRAFSKVGDDIARRFSESECRSPT
ncbi:membrane integrity-associated transporter subunit PqiC [Polynucleobacter asymbioticus]|uniref:ABC-type transport auxiliary lipoprotein component domain-containing protein n=1 Tax=Polynucleobacter asymbioticus (strain DSM 18221 / CIP 109841 / QLW-P1DMWA-1) TaxID=312153 RepID=A4SZ69_POLAQ|nr:PqiC family protein [Polynucleobacter asymbioticus]ABP34783.1 protein of unknown function DUF330 [Polynucleobacter asymbioticus QLW-P1DMWA-1]APC06595.1 hypothetical protein AOC10_08620 [Polynucleobacter asymbioticus]